MNVEFHYYATQLAALGVGWPKSDAYEMAYSSQHIDDNTVEHVIDEGLPTEYRNYISQTRNILLPRKDLRRIYPVFHFIPGRVMDADRRKDDDSTFMVTTPDSPLANAVMDAAMATENPFRIGIAMHGYVDTWAHQNFTGTFDRFNRFSTFPEFLYPAVGHAGAYHKPDVMEGNWKDPRLVDTHVSNWGRCEAALARIIDKLDLADKTKEDRKRIFEKLWLRVSMAIGVPSDEYTPKQRAMRLRRIGLDTSFGAKTLLAYDKDAWFRMAVKSSRKFPWLRKTHEWKRPSNRQGTHWHYFQEAIKEHQRETIEIIRDFGGIDLKNLIKEKY